MMASFTKWDTSLSGTPQVGPMGVPLSEVLLYYFKWFKTSSNQILGHSGPVMHTHHNTENSVICYFQVPIDTKSSAEWFK